jgi:hypothetical protein
MGRPRHSRKNNIRMDVRVTAWEVVDWLNLDQDRDQWRAIVNTAMKLSVA